MTRQYHKQWTAEQTAAIQEGFDKRMTDQQIRDHYNLPFSVGAIRCKRTRMELVSARRSEAVKEWHNEKRRQKSAMCLQEASIWHLVDLKRAGHSPTRTEYRIEPDGIGVRYFPEACGAYRSPAALMAEG